MDTNQVIAEFTNGETASYSHVAGVHGGPGQLTLLNAEGEPIAILSMANVYNVYFPVNERPGAEPDAASKLLVPSHLVR